MFGIIGRRSRMNVEEIKSCPFCGKQPEARTTGIARCCNTYWTKMPDITMCSNEKCPQKRKCYRYMAEPSAIQSYTDFNEVDCKYFWPLKISRESREIEI